MGRETSCGVYENSLLFFPCKSEAILKGKSIFSMVLQEEEKGEKEKEKEKEGWWPWWV